MASSRPDLPGTANPVLEAGQLLDADRPARMHTAGGDADFGAHAELAAVGELRRGVVEDDGAVDFGHELVGRGLIRRDYRIGVMRAVMFDVIDCGVEAV